MRRALASALRPAPTLGQLGPSEILDEELRWFFAAQDDDLSDSNFGRMLSSVTDDGEWRTPEEHVAAARRYHVIRSHLKSIPDRDAGVLQCAYERRPWPVRVAKELGRLTGIVVRLACDRATWPEERGRQLAVDAENAEKLAIMLRVGGERERRVLRDLRRDAQARFDDAIARYAAARRAHSTRRQP